MPSVIRIRLEPRRASLTGSATDELLGRSNLQERVAVPTQLAEGQQADQARPPVVECETECGAHPRARRASEPAERKAKAVVTEHPPGRLDTSGKNCRRPPRVSERHTERQNDQNHARAASERQTAARHGGSAIRVASVCDSESSQNGAAQDWRGRASAPAPGTSSYPGTT